MNWTPEQLRDEFLCVAKLGGVEIELDVIYIDPPRKPHKPPILPEGKIAVYVFYMEECVLKVGKAGPKSEARYRYQHYGTPKKGSTLAKSLLKDERAKLAPNLDPNLNKETVGKWIKENTNRVNFLLDADYYGPVLNLFEAFIQCRLRPIFEGPNQSK